ncbi:MAG: ATPase, T2SS/T4P/T4SS family [Raoultibacter sp.]
MSLMERVRRAGNDESLAPQRNQTLELLRTAVYERIPAGDIAAMAADNPYRAKNEIRSVCILIFQDDAWSTCTSEERERLVGEFLNGVFGFGPLEAMIADESITEVMVNGVASVFYERAGVLYPSKQRFASDDQVRALIDRIIGPLGRRIDESSPMVDARLPQGHRVHAIIPPLSLDGPVMTLEDMVATDTMDEAMKQMLVWAVATKKNIAVSGGTGTGKTTLLNALSCEIPENERIITIEDSAELRFLTHPHVVRLEARPRNAEGVGAVTIRDLVINALRMRPDRIVVGECRGGEALDMLQAMNTGHDGSLTTLHANTPEDAVMRLTTMVRYAADLPVDVIEAHVASALDLFVQIARSSDGRRFVSQVAEFGHRENRDGFETRVLFRRAHAGATGCWEMAPAWIEGLESQGIANAKEVSSWLEQVSLSS